MDTFRKWLNKPKADDKSLLARFYHADRSLTAVASELDSFDGRAEPDRCSRLVSRLRQGQDKVLAITNLIMEELLGEDRDPRAFRAKFPEEVLQENLAGQLWFGAECLAAGSSIMNREQESKEMRPLAQAVTKSLGNVRNLLRDQCLRNNVPNSKTLHLDANDSTTEQLYESLKIFDRLFAEFELRYVSAMVQVKTKQEYEMQELICVLFSETLQRSLKLGLVDQEKVDAFDPALMFSIPRLAIISGLVVYPEGPLNMDMSAEKLSELFRPFRTILLKIRDLLVTLSMSELLQLERLLCTNEEFHIKIPLGTSSIEAPSPDQQNNNNSTSATSTSGGASASNNCDIKDSNSNKTQQQPQVNNTNTTSTNEQQRSSTAVTTCPMAEGTAARTPASGTSPKKVLKRTHATGSRYAARSPSILSVSADSSAISTPTTSPMASPTPTQSIASSSSSVASSSTHSLAVWSDEDFDEVEDDDDDDDGDGGGDGDDDHDDDSDTDDVAGSPKELDIVSTDCASGYLILNTNFGNLLQPQGVPLTDNFIASEDEHTGGQQSSRRGSHDNADDTEVPTTSAAMTAAAERRLRLSQGSSEESEQMTIRSSSAQTPGSCDNNTACNSIGSNSGGCCSNRQPNQHTSSSSSGRVHRHHHHHHHHQHNHNHSHAQHPHQHAAQPLSHQHRHHHHHRHHPRNRHQGKSKRCSLGDTQLDESHKSPTRIATPPLPSPSSSAAVHHDTSSADSSTSSSLSDGDSHEVALALRAACRMKFKSTENLLHRLFVCIAGVADQLQTNFASDLRQILRSVFLMNMSPPPQEELDIPEKSKDSELFEFRASENDVIQESAGSNQSIYSAEEVNPELDNVFNGNTSSGSGSGASQNMRTRHSAGGAIQRGNTIDLASGTGEDARSASAAGRNHVTRSRSLGDQQEHIEAAPPANNRRQSLYNANGLQSNQRNRNNSVGSNSPSSSASSSCSESNSPVSDRAATGFPHASMRHPIPMNSNSANGNHNHIHSYNTNYNNNQNNNNNISSMDTAPANSTSPMTPTSTQAASVSACLAPPAWVPDDKAPRCMACRVPFTAFRRRHHCRNCGGVFCSVCSNASAPLPKYGLTKAVRMCRECYVREVASTRHSTVTTTHVQRPATTTAGGS